MIKFNRYSSKFEFKFSTDLEQLFPMYSAYGPIRLLRRKSDGKLFKVISESTRSPEMRYLLSYRKETLSQDGWNLVFFKKLEDVIKLDFMIPDKLGIIEALNLKRKGKVELIDPNNLLLIYEP